MLEKRHFDFCKEIGIMKENASHQSALDTIKKAVANTKSADPKFIEKVSSLTLNSPEVSVRSCILYHYDIDVDYVVSGNIRNTTVKDFGHSGVHDSLHITEFKNGGDYTVLKNISDVPYAIFNDNNLFTFEEMKKALTKVVERALPSNATSFQSKNWSVSAYVVPTLVIIMHYNKKEYQMYYNLQNNYYHWSWAEDPALLKKGSSAKGIAILANFLSIFLSVIGLVAAANNGSATGALVAIVAIVIEAIMIKKTGKTKKQYQAMFTKKPELSLVNALIPKIVMGVISVISVILAATL